ncbi:MAG: SAM-dependent methyltransferase [Candidatus Kapabacteria bacterium]|nr:SAM-dependent methyltransferase [Candidatus Kapabacteria bacterium]
MLAPLISSTSAFVVTFSKPQKGAEVLKVVVSGSREAEGWKIRTERFTEKQSFTEPTTVVAGSPEGLIDPWIASRFRQVLVQTPEADVQILRTFKGEDVKVSTKRLPPSKKNWDSVAMDRVKPKNLTTENDAAFLIALDLATPDGKIKASMADKFRQVNHLLATIIPGVGARPRLTPSDESYRVVDAGCGKAYLSLSLMYVLQRDGKNASLIGIDSNQHVVDHCTQIAQQMGLLNTQFVCGRIADTIPQEGCDLLIALHACDTATDEAIALGIAIKASLMMIAPCCHNEVQQQLQKETVPEFARPLLDDGITKERLGDLITDTMRRDILRALGYDAQLEEFISLEHTQKNILLRAELTKSTAQGRIQWADRVRSTIQAWGAQPRLMSMIELPK